MLNQYSNKIEKLLKYEDDKILIPDLVLEKEGIACGDRLVLSGEIDNNIILFKFKCSMACDLSKAVCNYIMKEYNDKNYDIVMEELSRLKNNIDKDNNFLFKMFDLDAER